LGKPYKPSLRLKPSTTERSPAVKKDSAESTGRIDKRGEGGPLEEKPLIEYGGGHREKPLESFRGGGRGKGKREKENHSGEYTFLKKLWGEKAFRSSWQQGYQGNH